MPYAPLRPCTYPGCPSLVAKDSRCAVHKAKAEQQRGTAHERGYTWQWHKVSRRYLADHPLCVMCHPFIRVATVVDHIRPHHGDQGLFWDERNWQALCKAHHDAKTAREDGRWGEGA